MKKRFVIKNSNQLGIDAMYFDSDTNKEYCTWYVIDKKTGETIEEDTGQGARGRMLDTANKLNSKISI